MSSLVRVTYPNTGGVVALEFFNRLALFPDEWQVREFADQPAVSHNSLCYCIEHGLARARKESGGWHWWIVWADLASPDHARFGFLCVKVLVPGTLPMTFGHANRRYRGISRLFEVPHQLGYTAQPLTNADINPHPHPFC